MEPHWRSSTGLLERIGPLPDSLTVLNLFNHKRLRELGPLNEKLAELNLSYCPLVQLPPLPESLRELMITGTSIQ